MKLWCLDDTGKPFRTGRELQARALARGWDARLFTEAKHVDSGYAFMRIPQYPPGLGRCKGVAGALSIRPEVTLIPSYRQIQWYEDKVLQSSDLSEFMPETIYMKDIRRVEGAIKKLGLPIVSKSKDGSSSLNVRFLRTKEEALAEANAVFLGRGIKIRLGRDNQDPRQSGYLLWQKFLPDVRYTYRVGICGRFGWMFRLHANPKTGKASGSGIYEPILELDDETRECWEASWAAVNAVGEKYCGLDLAYDTKSHKWQLLETTLGWGMTNATSTAGSMILSEDGMPTGRLGVDLFETLLDEIEAGTFDVDAG